MKIYHVEAGMLATNCYFAVNETIGEGVIFDPGGDYPTIKRMIEQAKAKVVAIVLTHATVTTSVRWQSCARLQVRRCISARMMLTA